MSIRPFHVAFPVKDLDATRNFYVNLLGCKIGRSAATWIDFDLYGHQLSAHVASDEFAEAEVNAVDGKNVPVRHWGVILDMGEWESLAERLQQENIDFIIAPYTRFKGQVGEQATMFFLDPSGHALEFKAFREDADIFRH
ncbi:MAG: VOC family protein [Bacteroidota bacterium]